MSNGNPQSRELTPSLVRWRIVGLLMTFSFMTYFNRTCMGTITKTLIDDFQLTETQMGFIMSSLLLPYTVCMTPGGWITDRWGPRRALMLMGFGSALFVVLTGLAGHPILGAGMVLVSFAAIRGSLGALTAPIFPAGGRMIAHWVPFRRQVLANALLICAAPLGIAVVQTAFPTLVRALGSWRLAFACAGAVTALLTVWWAVYARDYPAQHSATNGAERDLIARETLADLAEGAERKQTPWTALLRNRNLWLLTLSYAALGYFEYIFYYWMPHYFKEVRHYPEHEAEIYATIVSLGMMVMTPLGGWVTDHWIARLGSRVGRRIVPVAGMAISAVLLWVGANSEQLWLVIGSFTIALGCAGATEGPYWTTAIQIGGRAGGTSAAIVNTGGNLGGVLAPMVTPWVAAVTHDWRMSLNLGALICLLGAAGWFAIDVEEETATGEGAL
jgi:sugar phosphate permease